MRTILTISLTLLFICCGPLSAKTLPRDNMNDGRTLFEGALLQTGPAAFLSGTARPQTLSTGEREAIRRFETRLNHEDPGLFAQWVPAIRTLDPGAVFDIVRRTLGDINRLALVRDDKATLDGKTLATISVVTQVSLVFWELEQVVYNVNVPPVQDARLAALGKNPSKFALERLAASIVSNASRVQR